MTDDRSVQAPVALDIKSPMDLVYECFVKLGLRYICVLRDGKYVGMVSFVQLRSNSKCPLSRVSG